MHELLKYQQKLQAVTFLMFTLRSQVKAPQSMTMVKSVICVFG